MGFWKEIKNLRSEIARVESNVYTSGKSLMEVYERNVKLEAEIAVRTKELDTANKQMLTLQHILDMMNSSKPISSVLNAVVNNLQGELGYLYSCIAKKNFDENGVYYQLLAVSGDLLGDSNFSEYFNCPLTELKLNYPDIEELKSADTSKIFQSSDIKEFLKSVMPDLSPEIIEKTVITSGAKSYILVPLIYKHSIFGSLLVFSSRENATENELKFLGLFAKQIELAITIADLFQAVKEQAVTDGMTGLFNRRYFEEFIRKECIRADRQHQKFSVIGVDLDHLKRINDTFGHNYGDIAIKAISEILKSSCRSIDVAARMGGEEFNIILPGIDSQGGLVFAERIRKAIAAVKLDKIGEITASLGVATYLEQSEDLDELLELVDHAMYESKRNGRNRVTLAKSISETSWQELAIKTFIDILQKHRIPLDKKISDTMINKLNEMNIDNEILYQVSDMLISTYNPNCTKGLTKQKIYLASILSKRFDLKKEDIDKLKVAVLLYDIGNTMLPKDILNKKSPLTEEDILSIKKHPIIAAREILEPISNVVDIIPIIEKHHENWNGTGYPNKISGEEIPLESQIILILDSYFALLEDRPYREAKSKEEAIEIIMQDAGTKWSSKLAEEFNAIISYEE